MKSEFYVDRVSKDDIKDLLNTHHYLKDESKDFRCGYNYGLYRKSFTDVLRLGRCLGACVFTGLSVPEIAVGAFGLQRGEQEGLFELSRLCIDPEVQKEEYNITSWFVSRCIRQLRKDTSVRAILSYADADHHIGTIYRACNFQYYGLTDPKKDFYFSDGSKHSRGSVKGLDGEWRDRSRKHRYAMVFETGLNVLWKMQDYGKIKSGDT
jgi:hypothetical protein